MYIQSIPTRGGISRTFWILASFSVFFWKSAHHRLGPMDIFVKVHGISWNITLFILPYMAELIWFLLPGYKIALLNMSYLINSIRDFWSIQRWIQAWCAIFCARCAILCTVVQSTVLDYVSKSQQNWRRLGWQWRPHRPSDDVVLHTRRWFHAWKRNASWANRHCWQVDPFYNHDDDHMMMIERETTMTTKEWNPNIVLYSYSEIVRRTGAPPF